MWLLSSTGSSSELSHYCSAAVDRSARLLRDTSAQHVVVPRDERAGSENRRVAGQLLKLGQLR